MNEASDRVSDAEAAKPVLEDPQFLRNWVECGPPEELDARNRSKKWLPRALQAHPQVQLGSTDEQDAQICNAGSESGRNAHGDRARCRIWGEYRSCPGFRGGFIVVPWIWAWAVGVSRRNEGGDRECQRVRVRVPVRMGVEDEGAGADKSCCAGAVDLGWCLCQRMVMSKLEWPCGYGSAAGWSARASERSCGETRGIAVDPRSGDGYL
ncbi:hypothetical protein FB451DRAFT_1177577 [Mycena latifolia]|nr:hypothetical protein FB451DRAFT_1177577 [Mycena latifolia]